MTQLSQDPPATLASSSLSPYILIISQSRLGHNLPRWTDIRRTSEGELYSCSFLGWVTCRSDVVWHCVKLCDTVWYYVARCDTVWHYVTRSDTVWHCVILCDTMQSNCTIEAKVRFWQLKTWKSCDNCCIVLCKGEQESQWNVRKNGISQQLMNENGIQFLRQKRFWNQRACEERNSITSCFPLNLSFDQ